MTEDRFARRLPELMHELAGTDERYIDEVLATTARTRQRAAWSFPSRWLPAPPALLERLPAYQNRLVLVLLLVAMLVLLIGVAAFVGGLPGPDLRSSYEAVFLRLEVVDETPEVVVIGINAEGEEREIRRLPGAWIAYDIGRGGREYLAPAGAVSESGLLAIPSHRDESGFGMMHWEIFDLHSSRPEPLAISGIPSKFIEQLEASPAWKVVDARGGAFWGPNERLAIAWYECDLGPDRSCPVDRQLAFVDGRTGVATSVDISETQVVLPAWASDGSGIFVGPRTVMRPNGALVQATDAVRQPSCRTRDDSGAEILVSAGRVIRRHPDGARHELFAPPTGEGDRAGGFACLAPDGSMVVHGISPSTPSKPSAGLIASGNGAWLKVDGSLAGWLEVVR